MINKIIIRKAKPSDAKAIHWLKKITFEKINSKDFNKEQLRFLSKINTREDVLNKMRKRNMFCLFKGKRLMGTVDLEGNKISRVYVRWNYLNRGYGSILIKFIEGYAKKKGLRKVKIYSSKYAFKFYIKRGYIFRREVIKEVEGIKFINREMWKTLK